MIVIHDPEYRVPEHGLRIGQLILIQSLLFGDEGFKKFIVLARLCKVQVGELEHRLDIGGATLAVDTFRKGTDRWRNIGLFSGEYFSEVGG